MSASKDDAVPRFTAARVSSVSRAVAAACLFVGVVVLAGWIGQLPALTTFGGQWTPMVASTALSIVLAAAATLLIDFDTRPVIKWRFVRSSGALIAAHAFVVLANFSSVWLRGVPLYLTGPAWRMAPTTALAFLLLGGAFLVMGRSARRNRVAEGLVAGVFVLAMMMLLAFLFGATPVSELMGRVNMSPLTGLCLAALAMAFLLSMPEGWLTAILAGAGPGSDVARLMLPIGLVVPVLIGLTRLEAEERGLLHRAYGVAIMALAMMVLVGGATLWGAAHANRGDVERRREIELQTFLVRASDVLTSSLDFHTTLATVAQLCVPQLADWCTITLCRENGALETVAVVHRDEAKVAWAKEYLRRFPPDPNASTGIAAVARSGKSQLYPEMTDEILAARTPGAEQLEILRALGMRSLTFVPMLVQRRTVGVLTLVTSESRRRYDQHDLHVAEQLADRCATAIERAELTADLERRVTLRTAELGVANRELEAFAYSVSHDLRTPLRALDGFSQALLEDYGDRVDETGRDYLQRIRRGSQRMGDLIDALLDLSRVSRGELRREVVDLTSMASDIVESLRERSPDRPVNVDVQRGLTATGDARLLRALLQNLLTNAWKFTSRRADARIEFSYQGDNGQSHFVVRDNGVGFDMTYAPKLFGAFQRLHSDRDFEGTGVGLATAQRIVHRHGGRIWVEAAPDAGAAFFFTLS